MIMLIKNVYDKNAWNLDFVRVYYVYNCYINEKHNNNSICY